MRVNSSISPVDQSIIDAIEERPGEPIRIRLQPTVLRFREGDPRASYQAWKDLHWLVELDDLDEVRALREGLAAFFWIAGQHGIGAVRDKLADVLPNPPKGEETVPASAG